MKYIIQNWDKQYDGILYFVQRLSICLRTEKDAEKDSKLQRRNPLLADIFERLGYMERKGSGFGKIIDAYEFQVNYTEDKKSYFRSDRAGFVAIMPNLDYDVPQGDPQDGTID